jgi:hypothetical protein
MICKSKLIVVSVFLAALMPEPVLADSMRCGTHIISSGGLHGPGKYEVLKKCGEPAVRSGNTWIYEQSGGARSIVVFDANGSVSRIERR